MDVIGTFWALIPPIITIVLGLLTKKVNFALIVGILSGALLYTTFNPIEGTKVSFDVLIENVSGNLGVICFVILLGMFVYLLNLSGASKKYGDWARRKLKTKRSSLIVTFFLGILIFVDDYFNCLTVGTVMRPVTDKHKISREKLAYIIDTTAAPICMIAPISSWAAGVSSSLPSDSDINGFSLFLKSIPANYYSLFSLLMVFLIIILNFDFGKMKKYEEEVQNRIIEEDKLENEGNGQIIDLLLPVGFLIFSCILSMLYTGGLFSGENLINAFANCDAIMGLCMGTFFSCIFLCILYVPRKVVTLKQYSEGLVEGFKNMIPSVLILCFAWSLGGICGSEYLNAGKFISDFVSNNNISLSIMPMFFFVIAIVLSFSTGTSWGTFAILIPMEIAVFSNPNAKLLIITTAAVLGGSVCGDHLSPISDTSILSSTGAGCEHINHIKSQFPYGVLVAGISFVGYIISGLTGINWIGLVSGAGLLVVVILTLKLLDRKLNNVKSVN